MDNDTGLSSIRQIAITVRDVASALAFYRDVLGLEREAENECGPELTARMPGHELWTAFVRDPGGPDGGTAVTQGIAAACVAER